MVGDEILDAEVLAAALRHRLVEQAAGIGGIIAAVIRDDAAVTADGLQGFE